MSTFVVLCLIYTLMQLTTPTAAAASGYTETRIHAADSQLPTETFTSTAEDDDWLDLDGRIIGGYPTSILNFPYQVSLQLHNVHICGGAIIQPDIIITAAHCVEEPWNFAAFKVRIGSTQHAVGGQLLPVRRIVRHENYNSATYNNDVALIQLAAAISYSTRAQPVQLAAAQTELPALKRLYVSGWGLTSESGNVAHMLHYVAVRVISQPICVQNYQYMVPITTEMFCAGEIAGGKDSCQGDSGGPLVGLSGDQATLYGIVSWGMGCAQPNYPGVYAKVAALRPWIDAKLAELQGACNEAKVVEA